MPTEIEQRRTNTSSKTIVEKALPNRETNFQLIVLLNKQSRNYRKETTNGSNFFWTINNITGKNKVSHEV